MYNNNKIGLIIPTRYGSERLNGKVLCDIAGKKQIEWIIERALQSKYIDKIILAVSDKEGIEIERWYDNNNIFEKYNKKVFLFIGCHDDLMTRTMQAIEKNNIDIIVSASHDLTLIDPFIMDKLIERLFEYKADFSCNYITRTFPDGLDIGIHTKEIYEKILNIIPENHITRMWTAYNIFYWREKIYPKPKIINLEAESEFYYPDWRLTLDTLQDKILIEKILNYFNDKNIFPMYRTIINYLEENPKLLKINNSIIPTELLQEELK